MRLLSLACLTLLLAGACTEADDSANALPSVEWLVPYTTDANIPRHAAGDLSFDRAKRLLGVVGDERLLLKRTPFETVDEFQARGPGKLATLSPPVNGRSLFVFSLPAKMMTYDLAGQSATFCIFDALIADCVEKETGKDEIELSISSVALAGRAYSKWTVLRWTNRGTERSPVPVKLRLDPKVAEQVDAAGNARIAFVVSFGPPFSEQGPIVETKRATRVETFTTTAIVARLERVVVYQTSGQLVGAVGL